MADQPNSTVYLLKRAELAVRGCVAMAFAEVGITPSQYFTLLLVTTGEATSSAELARAMGVLPQSMSEVIGPLEQHGAIVRRPDPGNNRILRVELTPDGQLLFERATQIAVRLERELLAGFEARELERLNDTLATLIATAERHSYHPMLRRLGRTAAKPATSPRARRAARR